MKNRLKSNPTKNSHKKPNEKIAIFAAMCECLGLGCERGRELREDRRRDMELWEREREHCDERDIDKK